MRLNALVTIAVLAIAAIPLNPLLAEPPSPPVPPDPPSSIANEIREAILEALKDEGPRVAEEVQRAMSSFSWAWGENSDRPQRTSKAFMGILTEPVPAVLRDYAEIPAGVGVLITNLVAGGPAENSDLRKNDILLAFEDQKIINQSQLSTLIQMQKPGDVVELTVLRRGEQLKVLFTLGERRSATGGWRVVGENAPRALEIAQERFPEIAVKVLDGVDQWIPGSVRIIVDDEQKIEVDLKDLQMNLMELREKLTELRNANQSLESSGVEMIRDTEGRKTRIFVGDSNLTFADENGRLRMEIRDGSEYYWFWNDDNVLIHEGFLEEISPELDDESSQLLKRFHESLNKMNWNGNSGKVEVEMVVPEGDPGSH